MTSRRRVVTTPHDAIRSAITAADHLRLAAHLAMHECRSRAGSEMTAVLRNLEATIIDELRRRPEIIRHIGSAALPYFDPWPEAHALFGQQVGCLTIDDLAFLFDPTWIPLPRTQANLERLLRIRTRLEAAAYG